MTGAKKKGLSIGAAMKQRMDDQAAPEVLKAPSLDKSLENAGESVTTPPTQPAEIEVLESFNTRLPRGLHRRLKVYTAVEGHKIQDVVARAVDEYLIRIEKKES